MKIDRKKNMILLSEIQYFLNIFCNVLIMLLDAPDHCLIIGIGIGFNGVLHAVCPCKNLDFLKIFLLIEFCQIKQKVENSSCLSTHSQL